MNRLLKKGDRIILKKGMAVYVEIPSCFIYSNEPLSMDLANTEVKIGESRRRSALKVYEAVKAVAEELESTLGLKLPRPLIEDFIRTNLPSGMPDKLDTSSLEGVYKVIKTNTQGGGTGHGPHDRYPDGHYVVARMEGKPLDPNLPTQVAFYQSGSFTAMIDPSELTLI